MILKKNNSEHFFNITKDIIKQILVVFLYFFLNSTLAFIFYKDSLNNNFCNILISLITLVTFIFLFKKVIVPDFYKFKKDGLKNIDITYYYYILGVMIMVLSNIIISFFYTSNPQNEIAVQETFLNLPYYSLINTIIIAPITEELMCRTVLKNTFQKPIYYIILSGFLFGLLHVIFNIDYSLLELLYIIPYGFLGSMLALIYHKTNNIWTNITFHSFHNSVCVISLLLRLI